MPITSPVDCMAGPSDGSTPRSFAVENAGALTAVKEGGGRRPFDQPIDSRLSPSATRTASSTIGTPVTFERKGTVRDGVDVDLHALEVAVDPHRAVWIHHRRRGELADEIVRRVAEVDCQPADHE